MSRQIVAPVIGMLMVAGCATVSSPTVAIKSTGSVASSGHVPPFRFESVLNVFSDKPSWYVESFPCAFVDRKAAADVPAAVYGIAGNELTFWAETKLPDPTTRCVFAPFEGGFVLFVFSHQSPAGTHSDKIRQQIEPTLEDAMRKYLNPQLPPIRDLPNESPELNAFTRE